MTETEKVKIVNKIVYGAIAGGVTSVFSFILQFLTSSINLGKYDPMDYNSQLFLGTSAGNPNLVGVLIVSIVTGILFTGIIFGIIIFLLMRMVGWERDLKRYLIVAIVYGFVLWLLFLPLMMTEMDFLIDGPIQLIITLIGILILALIFYYLEERFDSTS
ncbi:MAG: hypothetical protein ACW981_17930 [Candidatus Hodarchaeales archaeon]|jgi:hypothetical protein